ncbi:MAG: glycosyltransferase family 39 protein [Campylobacterota bacterium]|nr:glycosyltransferase family 39 protein [Campylobacterota bacterium]
MKIDGVDRLLLWMQALSIVPLGLFLLIYPEPGFLSLLAALLLFSLLGYNIYRYVRGKRIWRYWLLTILIGSFLVYAFYSLGATQAPQSFENFKHKGTVASFKFDKPEHIDKICYYIGIERSVKFHLDFLDGESWKKFYSYDKDFPFSFRWNCIDTDITTPQINIELTMGDMMLGEVQFIQDDKLLSVNTPRSLLIDEQEMHAVTTYYGGMFFDEIYHGRTAYEIMHDTPAYETAHPYLGKMLIVPGIKFFGMTPFGWRFTNVIFGAIFIFAMYYFSKLLFRKRLFAFTSAILITYSFMHFTQSRVALIDTFGVLFVLVSYYFLYHFIVRQKLSSLMLSGLFFGLAGGVKWLAVFSAAGFLMIAIYLLVTRYPLQKRFAGYRLLLYGILSYVVVAGIVYLLTFLDIYLHSGSFEKIIDYQLSMYDYHTTIKSTHPYSSQWWSWTVDYRPMCYYREIEDGLISSITVFGNPAIFWVGSVSIFYLIYVLIRRATLEAGFILLAFLGLYLPYIFVDRLMFIYYFYYPAPFMMLAVVYMLRDLSRYFVLYRRYYFLYLSIVVGLFLAFYPVLSGYEITKSYVDHGLKWFSGWWF